MEKSKNYLQMFHLNPERKRTCMFFGKVIISLAECKSVRTQKLPFVVSITIELKI